MWNTFSSQFLFSDLLSFSFIHTQNTMLTHPSWVKTRGMERHCNGDHMSAALEQSSHSTLTLYLTHTQNKINQS